MTVFARRLLMLGGILLLMLGAGGVQYYRQQTAREQDRATDTLTAIAQLKVGQIEAWLTERRGDAGALTDSPVLVEAVRRWLGQPIPTHADPLRGHFLGLQRHYHYPDVALVDPAGTVRLRLTGALGPLPADGLARLRDALRERQPVLSGIHTDPAWPFPYIAMIAPLFAADADASPVGAIQLIIDARTGLDPVWAHWPGQRADIRLVRREGDDVVSLTGPDDLPTPRRLSLSRPDSPAVRGVLGVTGLLRGRDEQGVERVAAVYPVAGTDWLLLATADAAAIFSDSRQAALRLATALLGGLSLLAGVFVAIWQRHERDQVRRQLQAETALHASDRRFRTLFEDMPDPAWILRAHRFVEANTAALRAMGYRDKPALLALHPAELSPERQPDGEFSLAKAERILQSMQDVPVQRFDWVHKHRDGHLLPVEVTLSRCDWEGQPALYCLWRDLSERERMLAAMGASEARYQTLFNASHEAILLLHQGGVIDCNAQAVTLFGFDSKAALLARHPGDLSTPVQPDGQDSRSAADTRLRATIETGYQYFEWRHCRRDGTPFDAEVSLSTIDMGGKRIVQAIIHDISERKRREAEIRRYTEALDQVPAYIYLKDRRGRYVFANRPVLDLFGCALADLPGRDDRAFFPAETVAQLQAVDRRVLGQGETTGQEINVRQADGSTRVFWEDKVPLYEPERPGQIWGLCGISVDITERKQQEQQLRLSQFVLEKATDAVFWIRPDGAILDVNAAACHLLGYDRAALIRMTIGDLEPEFDAAHWQARWDQLASAGALRLETRLSARDGRSIPVEVSANYIRHEHLEYNCAFARDITTRKATEAALQALNDQLEQRVAERTAALQASEERFRLAMEATNDGVWDYDYLTRTVYCNPAYLDMLGYAESDLPPDLDHRFARLLPPEERDAVLQRMFDRLANPGHHETEFRLRTRDGSYRWILGRGRVVARDAAGRPLRAIGTHQDITARKQAEQAVRELNASLERRVAERTAQLEAASAAKTQFLAHMSHEIRTPMNAVLGLAQLLQQERLEPGQAAMVRHIREAGDTLLTILNDILDFSKIEAGQTTLAWEPFAIDAVLRRLHNLLSASAAAKGLRLSIPRSSGCPAPLLGDGTRVEQVLINLCANAIKFTETGAVDVQVTPLAVSDEAVRLRFEVRDTGIGMSDETQARLFQPFSQGDASISRRFGGTGLGLAISRRLVELMGGTLGVTSAPGQGSTFWFELPFGHAPDSPPASASPPVVPPTGTHRGDQRLAGLRVLVVDDHRLNRLVTQRALQRAGAVITEATHGQEALDRLREQPHGYDVVLMDIQMPVMDGLTATRAIRAQPDTEHLPVIALTAGALPEERAAALRAGVDDYLTKPLDLTRLVATLSPYRRMTP